ncbi:hypothetical protein W822_21685 [Advenella kashmirensis W13003]|uniref:Uncharacterized protein n=1 Tax=Advenella kashmirensis W13003 TaxID=1424334 RepID=V8QLN7_9BURK|nr:hypothetical protein W822_21685 [Advenella kashmirensis W13003]
MQLFASIVKNAGWLVVPAPCARWLGYDAASVMGLSRMRMYL